MTSQPGKQIIAMHILPNISRSKGRQATKCGQLIEQKMRNTFLEKSYTKCGGVIIPKHFSTKSKLNILWINSLKFYKFVVVFQAECYRNILKLRCRPLTFTSYKAFLENNMKPGTGLVASLST